MASYYLPFVSSNFSGQTNVIVHVNRKGRCVHLLAYFVSNEDYNGVNIIDIIFEMFSKE